MNPGTAFGVLPVGAMGHAEQYRGETEQYRGETEQYRGETERYRDAAPRAQRSMRSQLDATFDAVANLYDRIASTADALAGPTPRNSQKGKDAPDCGVFGSIQAKAEIIEDLVADAHRYLDRIGGYVK